MNKFMSFRLVTILITSICFYDFAHCEPVVFLGAGGYRTEVPSHCKKLPENIYRTSKIAGPTLTGQWWSSLIWQKYSQNMFAHPAFMRCDAGQLALAGATACLGAGGTPGAAAVRCAHSALATGPRPRPSLGGALEPLGGTNASRSSLCSTASNACPRVFWFGRCEKEDPPP